MTGPRLDLAFLLNQSAYAFTANLGETLAEHGVTVREYCVLMKAAEEERTQNVLAELAMLDKTTMVSTLDDLERAGLAERRVSATDRRARLVAITPRGRQVLEEATAAYDAVVDEALGALEPDLRAAFVQGLEAMTAGPWARPSHTSSVRRRMPATR